MFTLQNLLIHLDNLGLSFSPVPLHLFDPEEEEEDTENTDDDQFLQRLSGNVCVLCLGGYPPLIYVCTLPHICVVKSIGTYIIIGA